MSLLYLSQYFVYWSRHETISKICGVFKLNMGKPELEWNNEEVLKVFRNCFWQCWLTTYIYAMTFLLIFMSRLTFSRGTHDHNLLVFCTISLGVTKGEKQPQPTAYKYYACFVHSCHFADQLVVICFVQLNECWKGTQKFSPLGDNLKMLF